MADAEHTALATAATGIMDDDPIRLTVDGKIVDFLDANKTRPNKPEERVRQTFARKLHHEYGYAKKLMVFEAPIHIGSSHVSADIAIYRTASAASKKDQSRIALIVETKAPTIKDGEEQLMSYIFATSADGGMWVNNTDAPRYYRRQEVPERKLISWPNIPRSGLDWESVGRHTKSKLRPPHNLVETFRRCHNALYRVGIDSADLAMDMVRMILAKYRDETNEGETCEFRCTALEAQSEAGRQKVAARVRDLFQQVRDDDPDVFDEHENIEAGDQEIVTVVSELQDFRFVPDEESEHTFDVIGAAYEVYVGSHLKGDRGQYFTPRLVVQLLVRLLDPSDRDIILDPAVGSGGFLIAAMRHVIRKIQQSKRTKTAKARATQAARRKLFGIDKSPKLVKIAKTNMILASDGHAGLVHGDTLDRLEKLPSDFAVAAGPGRPTAILMNPPFGATFEHRITPDRYPDIVEQFDISKNWAEDDSGHLQPTDGYARVGLPPEYLFIERCLKWLAPGGKFGVVVPRGLLTNQEALPLRTMLLRETEILAVINCHDDTFKPHTDAKASLILCKKKKRPSFTDSDYPIFMAISQAIGHTPVGTPIYQRNAKGDMVIEDGHPVIDHDLDDIYTAWLALRRGDDSPSGDYYQTSRSKLTTDLNLNPMLYLPRFLESRAKAQELGDRDGWTTVRLGAIAEVFSGPRFVRPYADKGVTSGPGIVRYFTGNAVTQTRGENIKYLDLNKAKPQQVRDINKLYLRRGMVLVTRSGTTGRVIYATAYHDGAIGTEDLNRVIIKDEALRGYVYQFLSSKMGQDQLKRNIGGGIVDHVEPHQVKDVLVPVPDDRATLEDIGLEVIRCIETQEAAHQHASMAEKRLKTLLDGGVVSPMKERLTSLFAQWEGDPLDDDDSTLLDEALETLRDAPIAMSEPAVECEGDE